MLLCETDLDHNWKQQVWYTFPQFYLWIIYVKYLISENSKCV